MNQPPIDNTFVQEGCEPFGEKCTLPPEGWECTRKAGHDGPCAAKQVAPDTSNGAPTSEPFPTVAAETETPRTDAVTIGHHCKAADFARTLERELTQAKSEVERLKEQSTAYREHSERVMETNAVIESALTEARAKFVEVEAEAQKLQLEGQKLATDLFAAQDKIDSLRTQLEASRAELAKATIANNHFATQASRHHKERKELTTALAAAEQNTAIVDWLRVNWPQYVEVATTALRAQQPQGGGKE